MWFFNDFFFLKSKKALFLLKSRDITLPTKASLVKAMAFPVVMYECKSWTIKKAEHRRIDAFELWCWRRLLWVPWTARRSNQSILKEINPECSSEGLMLKLKLQYFGHLIQITNSLGKTLMLGKIDGESDTTEWLNWTENKWLKIKLSFQKELLNQCLKWKTSIVSHK